MELKTAYEQLLINSPLGIGIYEITHDKLMNIYKNETLLPKHQSFLEEFISNNNFENDVVKKEIKILTKGHPQWFLLFAKRAIDDDGKTLILATIYDITSEKLLKYDTLTGLLNRFTMEQCINNHLKSGQILNDFCVCIDVDNLKKINDNKGYFAGDDFLKQLAYFIKNSLQENDICGRIVGDEFFLYYKNTNLDSVKSRCQKIEDECKKLANSMSLSMGIYQMEGHENSFVEIMKCAEEALYYAKNFNESRMEIYCRKKDYKYAHDEIKNLQEILKIFIDLNDTVLCKFLVDEHYSLIWMNSKFQKLLGYDKNEISYLFDNKIEKIYKNQISDYNEMRTKLFNLINSGKDNFEHITRVPNKNGKLLWVKVIGSITNEVIDNSRVAYALVIDITDQMHLQNEYYVTYNNIPNLIAKYRIEENGYKLLNANERYYKYFKGIKEFDFTMLSNEPGLEKIIIEHENMRLGKPIELALSPKTKISEETHMIVKGHCVDFENDDPIYLLVFEDITRLKNQQKKLEERNMELTKLAYVDPITNGMNGIKFRIEVQDRLKKNLNSTYCLVCLNIVKFKIINDAYGTAIGDKALKYIFDNIKELLIDNEIITRNASDNYFILLNYYSEKKIISRLENFVKFINKSTDENLRKILFRFSIGVYLISDLNLEVIQIEDRADLARKRTENLHIGKNCTISFYNEKDREKLIFENELESKMANALVNNHFKVYLQPKLSLHNNCIFGAEALCRWEDPEKGLIYPGDFIPLFEKNGFIISLDIFVFKEVCRLIKSWMKRNIKLIPISINVSRAHFLSINFMDEYRDICDEYGVPTSLIDIEVTESIAFDNNELFSKIIKKIKKHGFKCSIDDFGSGYSSLNILKNLDVDTLKLDKGFFTSMKMTNKKETYIISAIIKLTKKLKIISLAEGIETEEQKSFLRKNGCDLIQGYIFSKPIPIAEFEKLLLDYEKYK